VVQKPKWVPTALFTAATNCRHKSWIQRFASEGTWRRDWGREIRSWRASWGEKASKERERDSKQARVRVVGLQIRFRITDYGLDVGLQIMLGLWLDGNRRLHELPSQNCSRCTRGTAKISTQTDCFSIKTVRHHLRGSCGDSWDVPDVMLADGVDMADRRLKGC